MRLFGNSGAAHPASAAYLGEEPIEYDVAMEFLRPTAVSVLSLTTDMVGRASLFKGEWIGAWSVWWVVALLVSAFPLLLFGALRDTERAYVPCPRLSSRRGSGIDGPAAGS